ncbi:TadE/TadG family type IV pilus assembly protein [Paraburkholderia sabiae]|uniref:TadE/TadG family type IV pilus assembly protein n=1 Tax=Paraburkholderia sabiae TaxID=273251 RepID=UPI001CC45242|nr:TadE family protein [Paraburkholderia sabiae]
MGRMIASDDGVVAVETAVLLPVFLLITIGFSEMYMYIRAVSIVERTAFTVADTLGQKSNVIDTNSASSADNLGAYWNAASLIAKPLAIGDFGEVVITSICDKTSNCPNPTGTAGSTGTPSAMWQRYSPVNGTNPSALSSRLPASLVPANWPFRKGDSALAVEVFYSFNPFSMSSAIWAGAPGAVTIYEVVYVRPRWDLPVTLSAS